MTVRRFVQLVCQGQCGAVYPPAPAPDIGARELRSAAGAVGWEVMHGSKGQDMCPPCRIYEINRLARAGEHDKE